MTGLRIIHIRLSCPLTCSPYAILYRRCFPLWLNSSLITPVPSLVTPRSPLPSSLKWILNIFQKQGNYFPNSGRRLEDPEGSSFTIISLTLRQTHKRNMQTGLMQVTLTELELEGFFFSKWRKERRGCSRRRDEIKYQQKEELRLKVSMTVK